MPKLQEEVQENPVRPIDMLHPCVRDIIDAAINEKPAKVVKRQHNWSVYSRYLFYIKNDIIEEEKKIKSEEEEVCRFLASVIIMVKKKSGGRRVQYLKLKDDAKEKLHPLYKPMNEEER